ncbi:MAG: hypothetical protein KJ066_24295 [Acidobacteria bacterium]|nr:hypothetical protein [Acidobacteriota bacterium]
MTLAEPLAHLLNLAYGIGASLACAAFLFLGGIVLVPARWKESLGCGEAPAMAGAALYVLGCWFGVKGGVAVASVAVAFASAVLVLAVVRHRWLIAALGDRVARGREAVGWAATFVLLYALAYALTIPPTTDDYLPFAWIGNVDLLTYLRYSRHLLHLEPSNVVGFDYLDYVYLQTPAVFSLLGGLSLFFGSDPMRAAMPAQFALTALIGLLAARVSRTVFGVSQPAAAGIACILISGPFFRYVAGNYFLSTLMSMPALLYLLWATVASRGALASLAVRFASAYVLLLLVYPFLFFAGLAAQCGAVILMLAAGLQGRRPTGSLWREEARRLRLHVGAIVLALTALAIGLWERVWWSAEMVWTLSEPGSAGWPLDVISPFALLGLPGGMAHGTQVVGPVQRALAIGVYGAVAAALGLAYFWRWRRQTTVAQQALAGLAVSALLSYCAFFALVGPSYQQWKFASYSVLPLSFVVWAGGLRLLLRSDALSNARGRRVAEALLLACGAGLVGGNLLAHSVSDPDLQRFPGTYRNLAMVDALPSFHHMSLQMNDWPHDHPTRLALYFLPSKRVHVASSIFEPRVPLSWELISRERPHLMQDYGCEGVGHDETLTVPGIGCLLFAPPSLALERVYGFNLSYLFIEPRRMGDRELDGRWNADSTVFLTLTMDPRRERMDQVEYVNLRISPFLTAETRNQRAVFSWAGGRRAEVSVASPEWVSLPVRPADWTGEWLRKLTFTIYLPDGVWGWWASLPVRREEWTGRWTAPAAVPEGTVGELDYRPLAVMFNELVVSAAPRGRIVAPVEP